MSSITLMGFAATGIWRHTVSESGGKIARCVMSSHQHPYPLWMYLSSFWNGVKLMAITIYYYFIISIHSLLTLWRSWSGTPFREWKVNMNNQWGENCLAEDCQVPLQGLTFNSSPALKENVAATTSSVPPFPSPWIPPSLHPSLPADRHRIRLCNVAGRRSHNCILFQSFKIVKQIR